MTDMYKNDLLVRMCSMRLLLPPLKGVGNLFILSLSSPVEIVIDSIPAEMEEQHSEHAQ